MYREPPAKCAICGQVVHPTQADVIESGLRCARCTAAAELAELRPILAEVRKRACNHYPDGTPELAPCWLCLKERWNDD